MPFASHLENLLGPPEAAASTSPAVVLELAALGLELEQITGAVSGLVVCPIQVRAAALWARLNLIEGDQGALAAPCQIYGFHFVSSFAAARAARAIMLGG